MIIKEVNNLSAIIINDLTKRIGRTTILDNINLEVLDGEFYSLLGTKDSGKTTLTKILMGFLRSNNGSARIYDMDCFKESKEIKESVSFVSSDMYLPDNIRAINILKKTLASHNLKSTDDISLLTKYFEFDPRYKFGEMNDREKKLFQLINALIVRPRLLILDSPTDDLTDDDKDLLFSHLVNINRGEGVTILLLTDSLIDAKKYSKRIAYIYDGKIKDVEYNNEKPCYDKILKIENYRGNLSYFTEAGAKLVKDSDSETIFYYDGELPKLSKVIYDERLSDYSLENARLEDKLSAYYKDKILEKKHEEDFSNKADAHIKKEKLQTQTITKPPAQSSDKKIDEAKNDLDSDKTMELNNKETFNQVNKDQIFNGQIDEIFEESQSFEDTKKINLNLDKTIFADESDENFSENKVTESFDNSNDTVVIKKGGKISFSEDKEELR